MTIKINRETFLHKLQSVSPGLSAKDILEQSSSFIFQSGKVWSFNEELACQTKSGLGKDFKGVIKAKPLIAILEKLPEDELDVEITDTAFKLLGTNKRRVVELALERDISEQMNIAESVGTGENWTKLHKDFCAAISTVQQCAKRIAGPQEFVLTCVHIHPKWVEASDDFQFCRWKLKTGISKPTVVRYSSIKHISTLGMEEFAESENWLHFKNASGLTLSCRRFVEEYQFPNADWLLKAEGVPTAFPKSLATAADAAQVFSSEVAEDNHLLIELNNNGLKVVGRGTSGTYTESKKAKYKGKPIKFVIPPKLLIQVVENHTDFMISENNLRVDGENWIYVTVLGQPQPESFDEVKPNHVKGGDEEEGDIPRKVKKRRREEEE